MKIAVECQSLLLQKSVEIFLKKNIVPYKLCDILITDKYRKSDKPLFVLQDRLNIPFSKSNLHIELDRFVRALKEKSKLSDLIQSDPTLTASPKNTNNEAKLLSLEEQIDYIFDRFKKDLVTVIRKNYEN